MLENTFIPASDVYRAMNRKGWFISNFEEFCDKATHILYNRGIRRVVQASTDATIPYGADIQEEVLTEVRKMKPTDKLSTSLIRMSIPFSLINEQTAFKLNYHLFLNYCKKMGVVTSLSTRHESAELRLFAEHYSMNTFTIGEHMHLIFLLKKFSNTHSDASIIANDLHNCRDVTLPSLSKDDYMSQLYIYSVLKYDEILEAVGADDEHLVIFDEIQQYFYHLEQVNASLWYVADDIVCSLVTEFKEGKKND